MPSTIRIHRVLAAPPERVYRAFLDADAMAKWLPPNGFTCKVHHMDVRVGGSFRMSFTNFSSGGGHSFGGDYLELTPNERIRYTDKFDDPNLPGVMYVTVTLKKVSVGTELNVVQEGVPDIIPAEACYLGWQESLILLGKLVEADIPRVKPQSHLCVLLGLVAGCSTAVRQPDHEQSVAEVTAAETAFAKTMADRNYAAFLTFVAEDAVFISRTHPLHGRAAVGEGWKGLYANPNAPFSWKPELVEVNGSGTLALSTGPVTSADGKVVSHYYSTWRRDTDGHWRVVFDNGYDVCDCAKKQ